MFPTLAAAREKLPIGGLTRVQGTARRITNGGYYLPTIFDAFHLVEVGLLTWLGELHFFDGCRLSVGKDQ